jgi:hypothetical protein
MDQIAPISWVPKIKSRFERLYRHLRRLHHRHGADQQQKSHALPKCMGFLSSTQLALTTLSRLAFPEGSGG